MTNQIYNYMEIVYGRSCTRIVFLVENQRRAIIFFPFNSISIFMLILSRVNK